MARTNPRRLKTVEISFKLIMLDEAYIIIKVGM